MLMRRKLVLLIVTIILSLNSIQALDRRRSRYRFNHPPSIESEDNVPVIVVYEKGDARENKALKLTSNFKSIPQGDTAIANEFLRPNEDATPQERGEKKIIEQNSLNSKSNTRTNFQIPVSVVHDTEPSILSNKENEQMSTASINRRKQVRRLQRPKENDNSQTEVANYTNKLKERNSSVDKKEATISNISPPETNSPLNVITKDQTQNIAKSRKRTRMRDPVIPIVSEKNFVFSHSGNFHYSFEGGDGTKVFEEGTLKSINNNKAGEAVFGGFSYKDKEGNDYSLTYTADENGYQPIGDHLPTPPPIPPAIARALKYLATKSTPQPATEPTRNFD